MFLCSVGETGFAIRFVLFCFVPCRYVLLFSYGDVVVVVRVIMYVRICMYACRYIYIHRNNTSSQYLQCIESYVKYVFKA